MTRPTEADYAADEISLCNSINSLGYNIASVYDFINPSAPGYCVDYMSAYPVLIEHLRIPHLPNIREGVVRALTVKNGGPAVWMALLQEFNREECDILRWALANALKVAMPYRRRIQHPDIDRAFRNAGAI